MADQQFDEPERDQQFDEAEQAFCLAIDALLDNLNSPDEAHHLRLISTLNRHSWTYRQALDRTATEGTGEVTDLYHELAGSQSKKVGFLLAQVTRYRQRRGMSISKDLPEP